MTCSIALNFLANLYFDFPKNIGFFQICLVFIFKTSRVYIYILNFIPLLFTIKFDTTYIYII